MDERPNNLIIHNFGGKKPSENEGQSHLDENPDDNIPKLPDENEEAPEENRVGDVKKYLESFEIVTLSAIRKDYILLSDCFLKLRNFNLGAVASDRPNEKQVDWNSAKFRNEWNKLLDTAKNRAEAGIKLLNDFIKSLKNDTADVKIFAAKAQDYLHILATLLADIEKSNGSMPEILEIFHKTDIQIERLLNIASSQAS